MTALVDRVLIRSTEDVSGCWLWQGAKCGGYGRVWQGRASFAAHRVTYEFFRSDIPQGLQLDHLCRVRDCVNPWHLEPVTNRVNTLRGDAMRNGQHNAEKTACVRGHEFTAENTSHNKRGHRLSLTCKREHARNNMRSLRARRAT